MDPVSRPPGSERLRLELAILASELKAPPPPESPSPAVPEEAMLPPARPEPPDPASTSSPSTLNEP